MSIPGQHTVLVVEDDEDLRFVYGLFLNELSLNLVECASGASACEKLKADESIKVALVDLTLPDQTAEELIGHLREIRPDLRMILLSGRDDIRAQAKKFDVDQFIRKPIEMDELIAAIQKEIQIAH